MRSVLFFLLISCFWLPAKLDAQTVEEAYARAEAFSEQGQYEEALKLYQRILFFTDESDTLMPQIYAATAKAFIELRLYEKSADYYSNAIYLSDNETDAQNWRLQKIKALLLHHDYDLVKKELHKIDTIKFPLLISGVNFYTGIYYFGIESYDSTHKYFSTLIDNNAEKQKQLDKLFRKNRRIKYTDPQFAAIFSVIIPGAGQIYSGNFDRGMQSFLLTSAFAVLGYNTYAAYGLMEALISVSPWYLRYYTSGIKNAKQLAKQKQAQKRQKVLSEMLILLPAE